MAPAGPEAEPLWWEAPAEVLRPATEGAPRTCFLSQGQAQMLPEKTMFLSLARGSKVSLSITNMNYLLKLLLLYSEGYGQHGLDVCSRPRFFYFRSCFHPPRP